MLCGFFGFLALIAYLPYARKPSRPRYALVFSLYTLCLLCKSMLVTLPCLLLLLDFWPLERLRLPTPHQPGNIRLALPRLALEKLPMIVPALVVAALTTFGQAEIGGVQGISEVGFQGAWATRWCHTHDMWKRWFALMAWPTSTPSSRSLPPGAGSGSGPACGHDHDRRGAQTSPWLTVGWLWYLGTLVPMIGLVAVGGLAMADRFSYFPSIGLLLMAFWSFPDLSLSPQGRRLYAGAMAAVLVVLCLATHTQIGYWKNSRTCGNTTCVSWPPTPPSCRHLPDARLEPKR